MKLSPLIRIPITIHHTLFSFFSTTLSFLILLSPPHLRSLPGCAAFASSFCEIKHNKVIH